MATRKAKPKGAENRGRFELDGEVLEFDLDSMTFGEAEEMELYFDRPQREIDFNSARGTLFIAYLAKKRLDPGITLDDLRDLKVNTLSEVKPERPTKPEPGTDGSPS